MTTRPLRTPIPAAPPLRPNILILYTDQQRWDALGANGNPDIQTPHLDRLAAQGLNFDHYFVQHPFCMPSRASFFSSLYPSTLRITHMGVPLPQEVLTLAHLLRAAGYYTANLGKLHFLPHANRDHRLPHLAYGFDHLEVSDEPGVYQDAYRAWVLRRDPAQMQHLSLGLPPAAYTWYMTMEWDDPVAHPTTGRNDYAGAQVFPADPRYTHTRFVAERTIEFLTASSSRQPFLCIAGFFAPHPPWYVPQAQLDRYTPSTFHLPAYPTGMQSQRAAANCTDADLRRARHGYYAAVSEVDDCVGQVLDNLDRLGLAQNTLVIFTSDHGEWLGDHLRYGKGYPGDDAISRVPLLLRWPTGIHQPGRKISALVEAIDVLPTLLECAEVQVPPQLQGQSLAPVLAHSEFTGRPAALMEHAGWKNLRTPRYRYLLHADGSEKLWDLQNDPGETCDVASQPEHAHVLAEHRHLLLQRLLESERPLPRAWPY